MVPEAFVTTFEPVRWSVRMYETVEEAPVPVMVATITPLAKMCLVGAPEVTLYDLVG